MNRICETVNRFQAKVTIPDEYAPPIDADTAPKCFFRVSRGTSDVLAVADCDSRKDAGCPLASQLEERLSFERLLGELSARFDKVLPHEVDANITSALQQIVEFLGIDRSGLGQLTVDGIRISHSYELPGVPPAPRAILDHEFPSYAKLLKRGEVFRLPEDLPPEADLEREYCVQSGLKSNLTIPLKSMGSVVGGIGFASFRSTLDWPSALVQSLRLVGEVFTHALERKRADAELRFRETSLSQAHEQLRQLTAKLLNAQEQERRRIAREMHDDWTQRLAVLGIEVAKMANEPSVTESVREPLRAMQNELIRLSEDVHALSRQLHPSILDDLGLIEALRSECASFSRREGIFVHYNPVGVVEDLPKDVALCVYRVAQEALRNVAKHAAVNEAKVTLVATTSGLRLKVEDCGIGFALEAMRSHPCLGLSSMNERVRLIHANLSVQSAPGRGTVVEVSVPLSPSHS